MAKSRSPTALPPLGRGSHEAMENPDTIQRWHKEVAWQKKVDERQKATYKYSNEPREWQILINLRLEKMDPIADVADGIRALGTFGEWCKRWAERIRNAMVWLLPVATFVSVCYALYKAWESWPIVVK